MPATINFLRERVALLRQEAKKLFIIRTWSMVVIVCYAVLVLSSFSYFLLIKKQNQNLKDEIRQETNKINSLSAVEAKEIYLNTKTSSLTGILASRKQNQQIIESLLSLLPNGIAVSNFQIGQDGTVTFSASCKEFKTLKTFLATLRSEEEITFLKIKKAEVTGVNYGYKQPYGFNLIIQFYLGE